MAHFVLSGVLLLDDSFMVSTHIREVGIKKALLIRNQNRELYLKARDNADANEWAECLTRLANNDDDGFVSPHPYLSFAPVRFDIKAGWFVDGESYMSAGADAMEAATEEIYITDWWLSPTVHLKRPATADNYWRLDNILKRKTAQGVHVFVLLYNDVNAATALNSELILAEIGKLHNNVRILQHPHHHLQAGVWLWAHHEKIVSIDQTISFVGGIDLCFGRWDVNEHLLTDRYARRVFGVGYCLHQPELPACNNRCSSFIR